MEEPSPKELPDFGNTEIAFSNKTNSELKKIERLFRAMNNPSLVKIGSALSMLSVKFRVPFSEYLIKETIYEQFCGGETLLDCQKAIDKLHKYHTLTVLDYGAEAKSTEEEFDAVMMQNIKAIEMAASNNSVPVISTKITGLADNEVLEAMQRKETLNAAQQSKYEALVKRIDTICEKAREHGVGVFIDAEEICLQDPIDALAMEMMEYYNKERVIVYNTYQLYRKDKLADLKKDYETSRQKSFYMGAKLVRGAYMEKERERAEEHGYPCLIHTNKNDTDRDFNAALTFCVEHYETVSVCCASHNMESNMHLAQLIHDKKLDKAHPHLNFCQLQGMSDFITFNLAKAGYNVAKYVVYGPVKEVLPYLIRRAEENTSITGEMGRELSFIHQEIKRRGL
ncbi:MAG: proline dehydrogenase family protein [Saprospiraceae bacterium]|nr:proline dehydrogenase family protein [Saprospiraceae bacterium]